MASGGRARMFTYGYTDEESATIDAALAGIRVPAPTRLKPSQGDCVVGDIVDHDADGTGILAAGERFVLFARLPAEAVSGLVDFFRGIDVPRPIFATVTATSTTWTLATLLEHLVEEKRFHEGAREGNP